MTVNQWEPKNIGNNVNSGNNDDNNGNNIAITKTSMWTWMKKHCAVEQHQDNNDDGWKVNGKKIDEENCSNS